MSWFKSTESSAATSGSSQGEPRPVKAATTEAASCEAAPRATPRPPGGFRPASRAAATETPAPAKPAPSSVLGATLRFKGELRADEDFVLQGHVEGSIHHSKHLTIGTEGVVKGDSRAAAIVVDGTIDGNLYATESISLRATARVQGNLQAPKISIAEGATFNGKVDMASAGRAVRSLSEKHDAVVTPDEDTVVAELLSGAVAVLEKRS